MFKECLKNNIVPFIIDDEIKLFYYRGLKEWQKEKGYLTDTCLSAQDKFKSYLNYFKIDYTLLSPPPPKKRKQLCKKILTYTFLN